MGKAPAFQFYPGDWIQDTRILTPLTRGIWIDMLCFMWRSEDRGKLEGTPDQLSRLLSCKPSEISEAVQELRDTKIADVSVTKSLHVTECNDLVTVINRRMYREERERKLTRSRVARYRETQELRLSNDDVTAPSSSSSSTSGTKVPIEEVSETDTSLSETEKIVSDGNGKYPPCPQDEIVNLYHKTLPELPRVKHWPENLRVILRTRWKEDPVRQKLGWWEQFYRYVHESDFLMGRTKEAFVADLEWLIRPKNFTKIANGRYHGRGNLSAKPQPGITAWLAGRRENAAG